MSELKSISLEDMSFDDRCEWAKNMFLKSENFFDDAKSYWTEMHQHSVSMRTLWEKFIELRKGNTQEVSEDISEVFDVMAAVSSYMDMLRKQHFAKTFDDEIQDLDDWKAELDTSDEIGNAKREASEALEIFRKAYLKHKSRLGLDTQESVAQLTGLDRRHISRLENGAVKPQFKTIKLIAEKFGAPIEEFLGYVPTLD
jgi:DNA-binding XRE family transcriptional regulator